MNMSDPELATKSPETDAMEDVAASDPKFQPSTISTTDTLAQSGPSMGEHCTTDRPLTTTAQPSGTLTTINGIDCYISKPFSYPSSPSKLLLLLTGGTGIHSTNNQLQADAYATSNFLVVMPDQFTSDPAPSSNVVTSPSTTSAPSMLESVKLRAVETAKSFMIDMWLARQTPSKVLPILHKVLDGIKDEYADAVAHGGGVYGVGYCFGAKYVLILCGVHPSSVMHGQAEAGSTDVEQGMVEEGPLLKCGAVAHGAMVTREDMKGIKSAMSIVAVRDDPLFPEDVLESGRKWMGSSEVEHEVKVFEGVPHGFAVLGDYEDKDIQAKQEEAFAQMKGWLESH